MPPNENGTASPIAPPEAVAVSPSTPMPEMPLVPSVMAVSVAPVGFNVKVNVSSPSMARPVMVLVPPMASSPESTASSGS